MVRTKADNSARKAVAAKAPRKVLGGASGSSSQSLSSPSADKYSGCNPVCVRPIPEWQKKIDFFFTKKPSSDSDKENIEVSDEDQASSGPSGSSSQESGSSHSNTSSPVTKKRRPVIESDEED